MKVILLRDISGIGKKNDIKNVSDGYASNFLLPKGWVETATPGAIKRAEDFKLRKASEAELEEKLAKDTLSKLKGVSVIVGRKASPEGHLFGAVREEDIAEARENSSRISIKSSDIKLAEPIKAIGEYKIVVNIGSHKGSFELVVKGE